MVDLLIATLFFITGAPVAYLLWRRNCQRQYGTWTVSDRVMCIICSAGGWASVLAALLYAAVERLNSEEGDKPASW